MLLSQTVTRSGGLAPLIQDALDNRSVADQRLGPFQPFRAEITGGFCDADLCLRLPQGRAKPALIYRERKLTHFHKVAVRDVNLIEKP